MKRRTSADELADQWVKLADPCWETTWPDVDEGRVRNRVTLIEVAADLDELRERPPLPVLPDGPLCSWCQLAKVAVKRTKRRGQVYRDLCSRCRGYVQANGRLPSAKLNERHRRRLGLTCVFADCV